MPDISRDNRQETCVKKDHSHNVQCSQNSSISKRIVMLHNLSVKYDSYNVHVKDLLKTIPV